MVIDFACPDCKRPCLLTQRAPPKQHELQHSNPVCKTWVAHKGKPQDFLGLALMAAKTTAAGNLILSDAGKQETPDSAETVKQRQQILEQLYEGMKKI